MPPSLDRTLCIAITMQVLVLSAYSLVLAQDCYYRSRHLPESPMPYGDCGELIDADTLLLKDDHFDSLLFDEDGLASVWLSVRSGLFYVSRNRTIVRTIMTDNSPDWFVEGYSRIFLNGKYGYMDKQLNVIIPPAYDYAYHFRNGFAVVCVHCTKEYWRTEWVEPKEHRYVGGQWGVINKEGEVVIPIVFKKDDLFDSAIYNATVRQN